MRRTTAGRGCFHRAGANLPGILELAKKQLRLPVQLGVPANVNTIIDRVEDPHTQQQWV